MHIRLNGFSALMSGSALPHRTPIWGVESMDLSGWIMFSAIYWLIGYSMTRWQVYADLVKVPVMLFVLQGGPRTQGLPIGVVSARGLWMQLSGILLLVCRFIFTRYLPDPIRRFDFGLACMIGFSVSGLVAYIVWRMRCFHS